MMVEEQLALFPVDPLARTDAPQLLSWSIGRRDEPSTDVQREPIQNTQEAPAAPLIDQPISKLLLRELTYLYEGYALALEEDQYVPWRITFTAQEAGIEPGCDPERVRAMVDTTARDRERQKEIRLYHVLPWHSIVRPESAACQAVDFIFSHDFAKADICWRPVKAFFSRAPEQAHVWTMTMRTQAVRRQRDKDEWNRLLAVAGIPWPDSDLL